MLEVSYTHPSTWIEGWGEAPQVTAMVVVSRVVMSTVWRLVTERKNEEIAREGVLVWESNMGW